MGITSFSVDELLNPVIEKYPGIHNVCELGAQNLYNQPQLPAPYAHEYYEPKGIAYTCIDLSKENNALDYDLSKPVPVTEEFDLVTNFGTSEHVADLYECFKNIHNLCKPGGIMIHENPKTGNWPGHGFYYMTDDFYRGLAEANGYKIEKLGENAAMGNITDGWNIHCVLFKADDNPFMTKAKFNKLAFKKA